jgi:hypothetical protein
MARAGLGELVRQAPAALDFLAVDVDRPGSRLDLRQVTVMNNNALLRGKALRGFGGLALGGGGTRHE